MAAQFSLSRRATSDLESIYWRGVDRFGLEQSERYLAGLHDTFMFLADFPAAARLRVEIDPPVRAHPYRSHLIVYEGLDDGSRILRIPHAHSDWVND